MVYFIGFLNFLFSFKNIVDSDYGWHVSVGRYILENALIPKTDIFSWYGISNNLEFISHEWLSDIIMYLIGPLGNIILFSIIAVIIYFILIKFLKITKEICISNVIKFIWIMLTLVTICSLQHRPYLFSYILFLSFITILFKYFDLSLKNDKLLFLIPFLQLLWVNLHGGSSTLILLILCISMFVYLVFKRNIKVFGKLFLIFILSVLASLINPYTYKIILYPFINMSDTTMLNTIAEWFSPSFHGYYGIYYFVVILIPIIVMLFRGKDKLELLDIFIYFLFLFMFLRSVRFLHYYMFYCTYFVGKYSYDWFKFDIREYLKINIRAVRIAIYIILGALSLVLVFYNLSKFSFSYEPTYRYSDIAIEKLIELKPERMYNDYNTGGYLTYKLYYTDVDIFINGIADIYSFTILSDACNFLYLKENPDKIIEKYDFDAIIIPRNVPLEWYLSKREDYSIYYQDDTAIIFKKI